MASFLHDGIHFHFLDIGKGIPFIFQHGLGADANQPQGLFKPPERFRLISFDFRGHGETRPLGPSQKISISSFADDLLAMMDHLHLPYAIVGGISLGAAVALNFALRFQERVLALVLSRPAWLSRPRTQNVKIFSTIAKLIRQHGAIKGQKFFKRSLLYAQVLRESPDVAHSLLLQFENPRAEETVIKLEKIPKDTPNHHRSEWRLIRVPTLILANRQDPIHPFDYGRTLASSISKAQFVELTPKSVSKEVHAFDVRESIECFFQRHFLKERIPLC